jgi:hypothetical protein
MKKKKKVMKKIKEERKNVLMKNIVFNLQLLRNRILKSRRILIEFIFVIININLLLFQLFFIF